jgi:hypothetical protein
MSTFTPHTAMGQDLDWVAFCYVADELNTDDRVAFEARLEDDLSACEAVARAVQLTESAAMAFAASPTLSSDSPSLPTVGARGAFRRTRAVGVTVLVASILVLLVPVLQNQFVPVGPIVVDEPVEDVDAIVGLWAGSQDLVADASEEELEPFERDVAPPTVAGSDISLPTVVSSVDVPDWLFVALQAESVSDDSVTLEN